MRRTLVIVESDQHSGNKLGLLNPATKLKDKDAEGNLYDYSPNLTETQRHLWELRELNLEKVRSLSNKKTDMVFIAPGDLTQGNKHPAAMVTTRLADQTTIAIYNVMPILDLGVKTMRICVGTGAHNFGQGSAEIDIVEKLADKYHKVDMKVIYHGSIEINGVLFDCAHHGPATGSRNWLKGNVVRYYLQSLIRDEVDMGNRPPDVVLRGHYHRHVREVVDYRGKEHSITIMPSMCMLDDHAQQATRSANFISLGMVVYEIIDGRIEKIHPMVETIDIRTKEVL